MTWHAATWQAANLQAATLPLPPHAADGMLADCDSRRLGTDLFHALSQPLTALCCSLELSLQQTLTADEYRESASRALQQAERVSWLTTAIRELFDAGQAGEEPEILQLREAVASAISDLSLVAESEGVEIRYLPETPCPVWFEAERLRRGLFHWLGFGISACTRGETVELELKDSGIEVVMRMTISGASPTFSRKLALTPSDGGQVEALSRRLGLGIALAIFQAAGGRCKAGAEDDRGCRSLEILLPRVTAG